MMPFILLLSILRIFLPTVRRMLVNGLTPSPVLFVPLVLVLVLSSVSKVLAIFLVSILLAVSLQVLALPLVLVAMIYLSALSVNSLPSPLRVRARFACARVFGESAAFLCVCRMVASYLTTASRLRWLRARFACGLARTEL